MSTKYNTLIPYHLQDHKVQVEVIVFILYALGGQQSSRCQENHFLK
jgi:hypothetical protein